MSVIMSGENNAMLSEDELNSVDGGLIHYDGKYLTSNEAGLAGKKYVATTAGYKKLAAMGVTIKEGNYDLSSYMTDAAAVKLCLKNGWIKEA